MLVTLDGDKVLNDTKTGKHRINGQVSKATNAIDSFNFSIFPTHEYYNDITPLSSEITVNDNMSDVVFDGRVLSVKPYMSDSGEIGKEVSCEGGLCYLCDSVPIYTTGLRTISEYFSMIISRHNSSVADDQKIYLGFINTSITDRLTFSCEYESSFDDINRNIISNADIGGEVRIRYAGGKRYLDYTDTEFTAASSKTIRLAKNMRSITQEINPENIITRLYPIGAVINDDTGERLTLSGTTKYLDSSALISKYGIHAGTVIFDSITNAAELRTVAEKYRATKLKAAKIQYEVSAVDIDADIGSFAVGCNYKIENSIMGINDTLRCVSITLDINDISENTLTFGDTFDTLSGITSDKINRIEGQVKSLTSSNGLVRSIVKTQTDLLCGDLGGNIFYKRNAAGKPTDEFFIDTDDIETATKALRINLAGIGFWQKSYGGSALEGPYDYAWTLDGKFNTKYIIGQVIKGLSFNNGNGTFEVDSDGKVTAKAISILGGMIKIETDNQNDSIIKLSYKEWTMAISPLEIRVSNATLSGYVRIQAGAIFGFWNDEKKFQFSTESGNITTYTDGEKVSFQVNTNGHTAALYNGSEENTIFLDGSTGTIYANNFQKKS